ncbi:MAG: 2-dehydro-3-deoxyphosphogluconate aldolase [Deltaproteobacteria bacterium]|nr:MAG: 2-dehydro-3-deoxyphosphogluconate aldolase [Deltaproteobacteria bacterium]
MRAADAVVAEFRARRAVAIMRWPDRRVAADAMAAAVRAGFRLVEFTLGTDGALDLIAQFAENPDLTVGAGTVLTADEVRACVDAGAQFVVSPVVDVGVIEQAGRLGVAAVPGAHTPTEMWTAYRAGAPMQKLFPAAAGGPEAVRAILGPLPCLRIVPTNGVTAANVRDYLDAGAWACGFVRAVFDPGAMAARDFAAVERAAAAVIAQVAACRGGGAPG